jgi:hypothetical protein
LKIKFKNIVLSIRYISAALAFFIFILVASIRGTAMPVVFIGGLVTYVLFLLAGAVLAGLLEHMDKEMQLEPLQEEPDHESRIKQHLEYQQGAELPTLE